MRIRFRERFRRVGAAAMLLPLMAGSCTTDFRDAAFAGVFDFVSGTITETLMALFPLAESVAGA